MATKVIAGISLFIFTVLTVSVLTAGLVFYQDNKTTMPTVNNTAAGTTTESGQTKTSLTMTEVSKHNSSNDCWQVINNKVYDLTSFLNAHPGGVETMTPYCGKDSTEAYATKDRNPGRDHSSYAKNLLDNYYVGDLTVSQ